MQKAQEHPNSEAGLDPVVSAIVSRVEARLPDIAAEIFEEYIANFDEYARLQPDEKEKVVDSAFANLRALILELQSEDQLAVGFDHLSFERAGSLRMQMGISIESLMRSFNVWSERVWRAFRDVVDMDDPAEVRAFMRITERIFWHVEQATPIMARGYLREAAASWTDREMTRYALLEALVTGRIDMDQLQDTLVVQDLADSYTAVVGTRRRATVGAGRSLQNYVKATSRIANRILPSGRALVGIHESNFFVLWPEPGTPGAVPVDAVLSAMTQEFPEIALGVGHASQGLADIARSYAGAQEASRIAEKLGASEPMRHNELQLERVILGNEELMKLSRSALVPLEDYDRRRNAALVETLDAYVQSGSNIAEAAKRIFIHPNTVIYRLRRIEEISGFDPREARGLLVLSLALLTDRLSGRPIDRRDISTP